MYHKRSPLAPIVLGGLLLQRGRAGRMLHSALRLRGCWLGAPLIPACRQQGGEHAETSSSFMACTRASHTADLQIQ
jgi:hypothetical protein